MAKRESREESEGRSYQYYGAGSRKPSIRGRRGSGSLTHQRATAAAAALSNANLTGKIQQMCHVLHQPQRPSTSNRQVIYLNVHQIFEFEILNRIAKKRIENQIPTFPSSHPLQ